MLDRISQKTCREGDPSFAGLSRGEVNGNLEKWVRVRRSRIFELCAAG